MGLCVRVCARPCVCAWQRVRTYVRMYVYMYVCVSNLRGEAKRTVDSKRKRGDMRSKEYIESNQRTNTKRKLNNKLYQLPTEATTPALSP